jgi:conjugal transfer/entry exclusion protein
MACNRASTELLEDENMSQPRGQTHPAPWKIDGWSTKTGLLFRVLDALNKPITEPTGNKDEVLRIITARNEDIDTQIQDMLQVHQTEIQNLNNLHEETHARLRAHITRLENLIRSLNYPE